jgi:molecular chaperone HscB
MSLNANDFELFGLTPGFVQDRAELETRWKDLQREAHPDKFSSQGTAAQRIAMQWSVRINEGYQRLKDPLKRAAYLCELHGAPINAENNTAMPAAFLMHQMQWREDLDDAETTQDLEKISLDCSRFKAELLKDIEQLLDVRKDYPAAAAQVRALMFVERFASDVEHRLDQIEQ